MKLPNKNYQRIKEQNKNQLKYYQMVLCTIKNLLPIKDILKYSHPVVLIIILKLSKDSVLEKQQRRSSTKWNKIE